MKRHWCHLLTVIATVIFTVFAHQAGAYCYFHFHVKNTNMVAETSVATK